MFWASIPDEHRIHSELALALKLSRRAGNVPSYECLMTHSPSLIGPSNASRLTAAVSLALSPEAWMSTLMLEQGFVRECPFRARHIARCQGRVTATSEYRLAPRAVVIFTIGGLGLSESIGRVVRDVDTMEMHQVRYFLALSETLNFTEAASRCNVSQPALTRAIQTLEVELGGELLRRERKLSHLTELGERMLPLMRQCYESALAIRTAAQSIRKGEAIPLSIAI